MKKYLEVFRLSFKMQIVWRFDVAMTMVSTVAHILTMWILWSAIFEGKERVGGFSLQAMLSYYIICSILRSIDFSNNISREVSQLIRGGRFSGHMVMPMNPLGFFSSMAAGESAFHLIFSFIAAIVCAAVFRINIVITPDITQAVLAAAMIVVGLSFMAEFRYFLGILAFKFLDIGFIHYMQISIIAFATGALVPLALLPGPVLFVLKFLPFTHVIYTPAMLLTGQINADEGIYGFAVLLTWVILMSVIAQFSYRRLRVKYDGVGI